MPDFKLAVKKLSFLASTQRDFMIGFMIAHNKGKLEKPLALRDLECEIEANRYQKYEKTLRQCFDIMFDFTEDEIIKIGKSFDR